MATRRVIIIGGGCAGMGAAHELVKLNQHAAQTGVHFEVDVYERADFLGGKCASQYDALPSGRWPGEHGFRFFPQFYQHLTATLREIPFPSPEAPTGTVFDNLRSPTFGGVAYAGHLNRIPRSAATASVADIQRVLFGDLLHRLSPEDLARYGYQLLRFLTSCRERRATWDHISWETFLGFDEGGYTEEGKQLLRVVPAVLSAMRARDSSARTIGNTSLQVAFGFHGDDPDPKDGILNGPTTEAWLEPWRKHLEAHGVRFHLEHPAVDFQVENGRLKGVVVAPATGPRTVQADATILAVPIEVTLRFLLAGKLPNSTLTNLLTVPISERWRTERPNQREAQLRRTWTGDMVGAQFYLREDVPVIHGHLAFPGSEYCLTAVAQQQFWEGGLARFDLPEVKGLLSVILSDWETPSRRTGKTARDYLAAGDEAGLLRETWEQMRDGLGADAALDWNLVLRARVDQNLVRGADPTDDHFNPTPLLIHPVSAYALRPDGPTGILGLYVASDYNRTAVDLATMEGANEGARQAVRAIARDLGLPAAIHPWLAPLDEGAAWARVQAVDAVLFKYGLPHVMEGAAAGIAAFLRALSPGRPIRLLGRLLGDFVDDLAHGVGPWDRLQIELDADHDGDVDTHDLHQITRGLLLAREVDRLRAAGAPVAAIEARLRA